MKSIKLLLLLLLSFFSNAIVLAQDNNSKKESDTTTTIQLNKFIAQNQELEKLRIEDSLKLSLIHI